MLARLSAVRRLVSRMGIRRGLSVSARLIAGRPKVMRVEYADDLAFYTRNDRSEFHHLDVSVCKLATLAERIPVDSRVLVDLGGNIGLFSLLAARRCPQLRILCVEADPSLAEIAKRNLAGLGNVEVIAAAVDIEPGKRVFYRAPDSNQIGSFLREAVAPFTSHIEEIEVETVGVDALFERVGPVDFLKVDLQGFESTLFAGEGRRHLRQVRACAFEISLLDPDVFNLLDALRIEFDRLEPLHPVHAGADILFQRSQYGGTQGA